MTINEAVSYIENFTWSKSRPGLERTRELLSKLGDPQKKLKFVHIAGSNGKGSTAAMLEAVLSAAGYRTGLYTSPHLIRFNERMRACGKDITDEELADVTGRVALVADKMEDHPSQFELSTAIGMMFFVDKCCDIVVLETGMGGTLDSTNVIDAPLVCVITNIGYDHTEYLGNTLTEIAGNKAGIIKKGAYAVCYDLCGEAMEVIKKSCSALNVPLKKADNGAIELKKATIYGQEFSYRGRPYFLKLSGKYQLYNAAVVLETVEALRDRVLILEDDAVKKGLSSACWPARMEILSENPLVILDGGHNPQCAAALSDSLKSLIPKGDFVFLTGMLKDKDYAGTLKILGGLSKEFYCVAPESPRALEAGELKEAASALGYNAMAFNSVSVGLSAVLDYVISNQGKTAVIFGSLYMAGEIKAVFSNVLKKSLRKAFKKKRAGIPEDLRKEKCEAICRNITGLYAYKKAGSIMFYCPYGSEADINGVLRQAILDGKTTVFPVCTDKNSITAVKARYEENYAAGEWGRGIYGIPEPALHEENIMNPEAIDLVIVPLVAFDSSLNRLGMGTGCYDRFLPKCKNALKAGAAFKEQEAPGLPTGKFDVPLDMVITDEMIFGGMH